MDVLKKLRYIFTRKQKFQSLRILVLIIIGSFAELLGVSAIQPFIDTIVQPEHILELEPYGKIYAFFRFTSINQFVFLLIVLLILIYVAKNLYLIYLYRNQYRYIYSIMRDLSTKMMGCYLKQPYSFHTTKNTSELLRNINQDTADFCGTIQALVKLATEGLVVAVIVVYLFVRDKTITVVVGFIMAVLLLVFMKLYKSLLVKMGDRNRFYEAQVNKWVQQAFGGIKEVKVMNKEDFFYRAYREAYDGRVKSEYTYHTMISIPKPVIEACAMSALLGAIGIKLLLGVHINYIAPTVSIFAVAAMRMLPSFNRITEYLGTIAYQSPSINSIYNDLREIESLERAGEKTKEEGTKPLPIQKGIFVKNLTFTYPDGGRQVLSDVSMTIEKNTSVAFVGSSGAGKTTLADIILGVLTPVSGQVLVDDADIRENLNAWHKTVGYIPQNIYLMDDTIRRNIAFGLSEEEIDDERVLEACRRAQLMPLISELEKGLETEVGERGVRLSGGQRQRIGIARALYAGPEVLILDEATSALDNETEAAVMVMFFCYKHQREIN